MDKDVLVNIKDFREKLKRDPLMKLHAQLADGYRRVGLTDDAIETCRVGLDIHPSYLLCREVLGRILLRVGALESAREHLEAVHAIVKDNIELNRALAKLYDELGRLDLARPLVESVIAKDPFDFEMRNLLAASERPRPEKEEAVDLFDAPARAKVFDIESILADDIGPVAERGKRTAATDLMLDALEDVEDVIETRADEIMAALGESNGSRPRASRPARRDAYRGKEKELHGAAVLAQVHMEIHLMEEALNLVRKLRRAMGDDTAEFEDLEDRLKSALGEKEKLLDDLEDRELARGL
ncbi:tetratricopeptide repeat protein [bacterium]|nr:tetratricopeptide repeat protein [bacterium]